MKEKIEICAIIFLLLTNAIALRYIGKLKEEIEKSKGTYDSIRKTWGK